MIRKITLCFILILCLWLGGLAWFVQQIPSAPLPADSKADAIVVFTGGSGRLEYGLKLLAEGRANKLFISGVHQNTMEDIMRHAAPDVKEKLTALGPQAITLGRQAENTIGNAQETSEWLKQEGYHSILLVTSSYHMPRSIEEFEEATDDVTIIPAPVFPGDFSPDDWQDADSRALLLSEYHKLLAAQLRHWLVSQMRHS